MNEVIRKSQSRIKKSLEQGFLYHHLIIAHSEKFLRKHDSQRLPMFVLYVDLVGSTKMSSELEPDVFNLIIRTFSQEMALVIEEYNGYVLKFVGDAVIGYFLAEHKADVISNRVVKCAETMNHVIEKAINPILKEKSYPELMIKTTIDFGECSVVRYGSDKHAAHIDLIGLTLNLAAKMQQFTKPGQITIGEYVYNRINLKNKTSFSKIRTDSKSWKYHELGASKSYSIYSFKKK